MKRFATASFATGLIIGSIFFSVIVSAWTAPTGAPPTNNASAPVNLSATAQSKTGSLGVGGLAVFGNTALQGTTAATDEMSVTLGTKPGQYRMINGNYGAFFRNDGANTYFLLTASGDQNGSWNALRPLYINDATGQVNIDTGLTVRGTGITYPDGTVQTTAASGAVYSGVFGASQSVTISPPYSSIEIYGKERQPNGSSTFFVFDLNISVFNVGGVWKYAWQIYESTGTGTLVTGVQQCVGLYIPTCITANANGTFTMVGAASSGYGISYLYTVN